MITHKPVSLADQIFANLERDILTGVYPRGSILTELSLSEALGVSRTPVREALNRLEQQHLVEDCGKGLLVLGITAEDARIIYQIRERLEGLAAAACASRITEEEVNSLRELIDRIDVYETEGVGKHRTQRIVIHYRFIDTFALPEARAAETYVANTRQGVAVEYIS